VPRRRLAVLAAIGVLVAGLVVIPRLSTPTTATSPATTSQATTSPATTDARVQVDQLGYAVGATKTAYAAGPELGEASFRVVDGDGGVALTGVAGADRGSWNARYGQVRALDLSALDAPGRYRVELLDAGTVTARSAWFAVAAPEALYAPALTRAVGFFALQRDGADQVADGRVPSHLLDSTAALYDIPEYADDGETLVSLSPTGGVVDVEGGWFDAGDYLKFTGTTAYATLALLLAERDGLEVAGLADEAQHGLDWLGKAWDPTTGTLVVQVGLGNGNDAVLSDHDVWRLPEDDDVAGASVGPDDPSYLISHRPAFATPAGEPVPPALAGRTAAAFAVGAQLADARGDRAGARALLAQGAGLLAAADTSPSGPVLAAVPVEFYPEDSWTDDLELAAVELARAGRALGDDRADAWAVQAEQWAVRTMDAEVGPLGVADVSALAHAELAASTTDAELRGRLLAALRAQLEGAAATADTDPFGAGVSTVEFDSAPFALGLAATALLYERAGGDDRFAAFAADQLAWVLGANAWGSSFVIGSGTDYPRCPEHQVANLTGREATGAVVNGPNAAELLEELNGFDTMVPCDGLRADGTSYADGDGRGARYLDAVGAWQTDEPAIDFTASSVLAFALAAGE